MNNMAGKQMLALAASHEDRNRSLDAGSRLRGGDQDPRASGVGDDDRTGGRLTADDDARDGASEVPADQIRWCSKSTVASAVVVELMMQSLALLLLRVSRSLVQASGGRRRQQSTEGEVDDEVQHEMRSESKHRKRRRRRHRETMEETRE